MANLFVSIVAPDKIVFEGEAAGVRVPGVEGSFEVLYNHAPMIAAFGAGPIFLRTGTGERIVFATSGGFLEVIENHVNVLTDTAEPASEIDLERARAAEERALQRLALAEGAAERLDAERELERARTRARVAMGQVGRRTGV